MKIVTKRKAEGLMVDTLFKGTKTATRKSKFDAGKYKWTGSQKDYVGKDVPDIEGVIAVYVERRVDADGPYAQIMSISY